MGPDKSKLTKARIELEELYSGIPDDSVNLTFQDFAEVHQSNTLKNINPPPDPVPDHSPGTEEVFPLARMPSLDFNRGLQGFNRSDHPVHYQNPANHHRPHVFPLQSQYQMEDFYDHGSPAVKILNRATSGVPNRATSGGPDRGTSGGLDHGQQKHQESRGHHHQISTPVGSIQQYPNGSSPYSHAGFSHAMGTASGVYDDMSHMSGMSIATEKGGRRRPGIPHSNICTVCCNYIYIFRHRCLVCGRVYCRQCVGIGMGEMSEGRKCIECLGRKFSQRYIQKAGQVGCCAGYPTVVKQQELKWAEKGARKTGENRYGAGRGGGGGGGMVSQSMQYPAPRTPGRPNNGTPAASSAPTSFVISSAYSPYHSPISHAPF